VIVSTVNIYEVFKWVLRQRTVQEAFYAVAIMFECHVIALDTQLALEAVLLSKDHKLSFADSIILATAQVHGAILWTQDAHFAGIAGVQYIPK
jgi:predicted nucleic acid-binding protein